MSDLQTILIDKRKSLKLSLRAASDLIGISHSYLSTLEKGIDPRTGSPVSPTPETLMLISKAYKIEYEELMKLAGYLREYTNINEELLDDEDFKRLIPLLVDHLNNSIITKYDDKRDPEITDALDLEEAWKYLDDGEKTEIFNSIFKKIKYNKSTGGVSLTQYFIPGPEGFEKIKQDYLDYLAKEEKRENKQDKNKYPEVHDVEEAMKIILEQPGLMLKGEILSDESKIILANAIQMGLRTAEELEKKKNKGDSNE